MHFFIFCYCYTTTNIILLLHPPPPSSHHDALLFHMKKRSSFFHPQMGWSDKDTLHGQRPSTRGKAATTMNLKKRRRASKGSPRGKHVKTEVKNEVKREVKSEMQSTPPFKRVKAEVKAENETVPRVPSNKKTRTLSSPFPKYRLPTPEMLPGPARTRISPWDHKETDQHKQQCSRAGLSCANYPVAEHDGYYVCSGF